MMHERICVLYSDLAAVRLAIFQFQNSPKGPRTVIPHYADDVELLAYDVPRAMAQETYKL